ncbi:uncharacterized protein LOC132742219 [Ruditapes philippinarum]|uniref:uncharacterized protein LOC132742219 n=1 Tax=Ruditapes philippinarum TaxID=129788 RepID=UPI00295C1E67|nr:uncharacterized protein LOC132742219 [Ruditapes philippinarum]
MCECLQSRTCKGILLVLGIVFTVVGIVFDWMNFCEMKTNVDLLHDAKKDKPVNECKIQLQTYTWVYFAFVLLKLVISVIEIPVDIYRYYNNTDPIVRYLRILFNDFTMLILKVIVGAFECVSLIMLLIVSSSCLRLEGKNVFPDISPDLLNDFLGGIFGLFGIVVSRILIKNMERIVNVCKICWNACCNQQAPGEQEIADVGGQAPGEQEIADVETNCCNGFFLIIFIVLVIALTILNILLLYAFCSVN